MAPSQKIPQTVKNCQVLQGRHALSLQRIKTPAQKKNSVLAGPDSLRTPFPVSGGRT